MSTSEVNCITLYHRHFADAPPSPTHPHPRTRTPTPPSNCSGVAGGAGVVSIAISPVNDRPVSNGTSAVLRAGKSGAVVLDALDVDEDPLT